MDVPMLMIVSMAVTVAVMMSMACVADLERRSAAMRHLARRILKLHCRVLNVKLVAQHAANVLQNQLAL